MAHLPQKGSPPPRPPSPLSALYGSKKGIQRISDFSEQPRNSVRTLFGCYSICLRKILACVGRRGCQGVVNAAASTGRRKRCGVAPTHTWLHENFGASQLRTDQINLFL